MTAPTLILGQSPRKFAAIALAAIGVLAGIAWLSGPPADMARYQTADGRDYLCVSHDGIINTVEQSSYGLTNRIRVVRVTKNSPQRENFGCSGLANVLTNAGPLVVLYEVSNRDGQRIIRGQIL